MALDVGELVARLSLDQSAYNRGLDDSQSKFSKFSGAIGTAAKLAGAAGIAAIGAIAVEGFKAAEDYQKITARTANVLETTRGAAGVTAAQVKDLSDKISGYSGMTDEAVQSGANLLLTFTGIKNQAGAGNDIFNQSVSIMGDLSTALGQDTSSSAIQLGKALNDPIKGVTALQRVGVSFTAAQKAQIKTLVDSGNTMGAQKIILGELNTEFGGAAKAAGETFKGSLDRLKNSFSDMVRDGIMPVLPYLTSFVEMLARDMPAAGAVLGKVFSGIGSVANATVVPAIALVIGAVKEFVGIFASDDFVGGPFERDSSFISGIFTVRDAINTAWAAVKEFIGIFSKDDFVGGPFEDNSTFIAGIFKVSDVFHHDLIPAFHDVEAFLKDHIAPIMAVVSGALAGAGTGALVGALTAVVTVIAGPVIAALGALLGALTSPIVIIGALVGGLIYAYTHFTAFRKVVADVGTFINQTLLPAFKSVGGFLISTFTPTFHALVNLFTQNVLPAFQGLLARLKDNAPAFEGLGKVIAVVAIVIAAVWLKIEGFLLPILLKLAGVLITTVFAAIGVVIGILGTIITVIGNLWAAGKTAASFLGTAFSDIGTAGSDMWNKVLQPAFASIVGAFLSLVGVIVHGAADAFGWVPGIGGGLKGAAADFDTFSAQVNASLAGIQSKTINVTAITGTSGNVQASNSPSFHATGGAIHGPGTGTSDSIPAMLSDGEHVWTAEEVRKAGGHAAVAQIRQAVRRYATGGPVDRLQVTASADSGPLTSGLNNWYAGVISQVTAAGQTAANAAAAQAAAIGAAGAGVAPTGANVADVWRNLISQGFSAAQSAGIMGNMQSESGFNPFIIQGGGTSMNPAAAGGGGYGLVQWTPGAKLIPLLNGAAPSIQSEVAALVRQLNGSEGNAGRALMATNDPVSAANVFGLKYERYAGPPQGARAAQAQAIYNRFAGSAGVFDGGGVMYSGQVGVNTGRKPERVLSPAQTDAFERLVQVLEQGGTPAGRLVQTVYNGDFYSYDPREVELARERGLAEALAVHAL